MSAARSVRSSPTRRRGSALLVTGVAAALLVLAACGGGGKKSTDTTLQLTPPNVAANDPVRDGGTITMALEKDVPNFDPLSSDGQSLETQMVLNGVFPATYVQQPDYTVRLNSDLLVSAEQTSSSPQTIVYKIKPNAVWSDGTAISADDFVYNWETQSGTDPAYSAATSTGYEDISSVRGSDGGKTVTVTFSKSFADWQSLFGALLPAHVLKAGDAHALFNDGPASIAKVSGGPFVLDAVQANKSITLKRNDRYYGPRAHLDSVVFSIISDANVEPQALANNEVQLIYPQPQIDLVGNVRRIGPKVTYEVGLGPQFEHVDLNLASPSLAQLPIRKALLTAIDRNQLLASTVKQFSSQISPLNNRIFVQGQAGYQDDVTAEGLGSGNVEAAKKILTDAGYRIDGNRLLDPGGKQVPTLKGVYPKGVNPIRQQEFESMQRTLGQLGLQIDIAPSDDFGTTVFGKGDFDIAVFGWVGSPFPSSVNASIYSTDGGQNGGKYSSPVVDRALTAATAEPDPAKAAVLLNEADRQLSRDAATLPLYQKPTFLAYYGTYGNIRNNTTSVGPTYNIGQWGLKK